MTGGGRVRGRPGARATHVRAPGEGWTPNLSHPRVPPGVPAPPSVARGVGAEARRRPRLGARGGGAGALPSPMARLSPDIYKFFRERAAVITESVSLTHDPLLLPAAHDTTSHPLTRMRRGIQAPPDVQVRRAKGREAERRRRRVLS